ncbi:TolC family protein [Alienimonas chondri]|uniref:TolC family protein n=1 Tax=Alienimonas chondri TaxID=2681879 RepID=A0ABX1VAY3_9PLAN|nr:TolC family protein [Alienimonas chondri]NNJ24904.1 hypothetical protein [Alienimonas chondri]
MPRPFLFRHAIASAVAAGALTSTVVAQDFGRASLNGPLAAPPPVPTRGNLPVPSDIPELHADDDGPIGRSFVEPPPVPEAPWSLDVATDGGRNAAFAGVPLTLEEALEMAAANNPTLVQARAQVQGTLGLAVEAGLWPNPTFRYIGEQIGVDREGETDTPGEFQGATITQEFVTADKRDISRAKFLQRTRVAEWAAVSQQWRVCNDVRVHFYQALGAKQTVAIREDLLKAAEDALVTAREQWNLGQATRSDLHLANVALQEARLNLLMAENDYLEQFQTLASLIGLPLETGAVVGELDGETAEIDFEQVYQEYLEEAPQVIMAKQKLREDQITLKRELVEPIPNVFVEAGSGYNFEALETTGALSVSLDIPIFDRNQGNIRRAEADLVRQRREIQRTEMLLRRDLAMQYRRYLTARQHVEQFAQVILPEARAAYKNQLDAYAEDRQQWTDVLKVQSSYFDLRQRYIGHLVALRTSETLIRGYLLHDGLNVPAPLPPGHLDVTAQPR